jgi:hypothetical protein
MTNVANNVVSAADRNCPVCGAPLRADDTNCWLCCAIADTGQASTTSGGRTFVRNSGFSFASSLLLFVTLLSVVLGLSTIAPGIGIPLGVLLLIAWGRTASVSRRRAETGKSFTSSEKIQAYISSLGFIVLMLVLVTICICIAFGSVCLGFVTLAGALDGSPTSRVGAIIACIVGTYAAFGLLHIANKWNDDQFWRAAGRSKATPNKGRSGENS